MIKKGGSPAEAKKLAEKFQEEVIAVMLAKGRYRRAEPSHHR